MNWDAIGAVGELIGAIAVVFTLIYLANQVRSSAKATESQVLTNLSVEMEKLLTIISQDSYLAQAMLLAQRGEQLDEEQSIRLGYWFSGFLRVCESHYLQMILEATEIDLSSPIAELLKGDARVPLFRGILESVVERNSASKEFICWIDEVVLSESRDT